LTDQNSPRLRAAGDFWPEQLRQQQQTKNMKTETPSVASVPSALSHTPGPWIGQPVNHSGDWRVFSANDPHPGPSLYCSVDVGWGANARAIAAANARLIAAAPELLAALQECVAWFDLDAHRSHPIMAQDTEVGFRMIQAARAALAKATGQA
jgi:hypothetical protein